MLLLLTCAVFLLVVMPGLFLWLGHLIQANIDTRFAAARRGASAQGSAGSQTEDTVASWVRRPMRPAFGQPLFGRPAPVIDAASEPPAAEAKSWVRRPMLPAFGR